jgi:hypothetical protein
VDKALADTGDLIDYNPLDYSVRSIYTRDLYRLEPFISIHSCLTISYFLRILLIFILNKICLECLRREYFMFSFILNL